MSHNAPPSPESFPPGGISINTDSPVLAKKIRRKKTPFWRSPMMLIALFLLGGAGGVFYLWLQQQTLQGMTLLAIDDTAVDELSELKLKLPFSSDAVKPSAMKLKLVQAPKGAQLDHETAHLIWTPTEEQGPGEYDLMVEASPRVNPDRISRQKFRITVNEVNTPPTIEYIDPVIARTEKTVKVHLNVIDPDLPHPDIRYELIGNIPDGARVEPEFGIFEWRPGDELANQVFEFEVKASEADAPEMSATRKFQVSVKLYDPVDRLKDDFADRGIKLEDIGSATNAGFAGTARALLAGDDRLDVYSYDSKAAADKEAELIAPDLKQLFGKKDPFTVPAKIYRTDRMYVVAAGVSDELHAQLAFQLGTAIASTNNFAPATVAGTDSPSTFGNSTQKPPNVETDASLDPAGDAKLVELYDSKDLFDKKKYPEIRRIFADRFARAHADAITAAFGADLEELTAWLDEHQDLKEELYTAIDPQYDNPLEALRVFHDLWESFPDLIEEYGPLAIATAVVWDNPRRGVYDYTRHQKRTHSIMPEDDLMRFPSTNFTYLVNAEKYMEGRAQLVPWEFMVHLVNHKTPLEERNWAMYNYLPKRQMFGKCYSDVPYDDLMLATQSAQCRLDGKDYTLANLKEFGGVCAMQADFAARVGKSLGVPAEYVRGPSIYGDYHAWVMWVELKNLTKTGINFSLESHGRYRGDKYYVGELQDPQTGTWISDRELELRLHTIGLDPIAKRQADFIMTAYPMIKDRRKFSIDDQVEFLEKVIKLSPGTEASWQQLAAIAAEGNLSTKHERQMRRTLDLLFVTFTNFPDFTWKVFDNLIQYEENIKKQIQLYQRLIELYVSAGRPDLASEARLMLTGYLIDDQQQLDAIEGLAATIMAFPDEGRYVPKMLDRLEVIATQDPRFQRNLINFYSAFLPKVPQRRGDAPSKYCIKMYERGIKRFEEAGATNEAAKYKGLLAQLKGGAIGN